MKTGASFSRGKSRQDYETPAAFIRAVEKRFGPIAFDLAASPANAKARKYFTKETNAFAHNWHKLKAGLLWLNPEFDDIAPWAEKCAFESSDLRGLNAAKILFLVPASVGSNWFRDYCAEQAHTIFLNGRLSFDGKNPYPKDCMLCLFGFNGHHGFPGTFSVWTWKA